MGVSFSPLFGKERLEYREHGTNGNVLPTRALRFSAVPPNELNGFYLFTDSLIVSITLFLLLFFPLSLQFLLK